MPPHPLLLQATEAATLAAEAGHNATQQVAKGGESAAIAWFLFLLSLIALVILAVLYWRELKGKHQEMQAAAQAVREEAAREIAIDAAHNEAQQKQQAEMYKEQIRQLTEANQQSLRDLKEINQELRRQESKSIEVLGATGNTIRDMNNSITQVIRNQDIIVSLLSNLTGQPRPLPLS